MAARPPRPSWYISPRASLRDNQRRFLMLLPILGTIVGVLVCTAVTAPGREDLIGPGPAPITSPGP